MIAPSTWTVAFGNQYLINGDITRVRTTYYSFKCNL